ncbi:MAG: outer membrane beta-barrel protein [Cyanobacteriota bacterium]|nr:outer membrane beta-barrel protein [Cyanobacteriota bacterium]
MTSIRNAFVRSLGAALAGSALLAAPSFAGTEPSAEAGAAQLQPSNEAPLQIGQSAPKDTEIAQTYIPLVGEVGSASVQGTGFYITVGAGAAWPSDMNVRTRNFDPNENGDLNFGGGFSVDAGVGYDFGALRTELTYGYTRSSINNTEFDNQDFSSSGIINKNDVMASVYLDVPFGAWVPYIGGGVGYTNLSTPGIKVDGDRFGSSNEGLFGWQAKAGVAYALSWSTDIYVEGTYSGASGFSSNNLRYDSYNDFGAKLGFRYRFSSPPVVVVEQPAPAPEPAPAPMPMPEPAPEPAPIRGLW